MDYKFWLGVYVVGCVLTIVLNLLKVAITLCFSWVSKVNVVNKNLKKIQRPEPSNRAAQFGVFVAILLFEGLLSWINVPIVIWQTVSMIAKSIREVFTSVPEKVKELRFPLKNNPDLDAESVWAYLLSLNVTVGAMVPTDDSIASELKSIRSYRTFNPRLALRQLQRIGVVEPDVVAGATSLIKGFEDHGYEDR